MHWLWIFIIGLVIGIIAKLIMPGKDPGGFIITAIIGIIGSFIGGWIARSIFGVGGGVATPGAVGGVSGFWGFVFGVIGAIILLILYRLVFHRKPAP